MVHHGALQRRHDLLAMVDGQSNVAVKQALPALVDADPLSARIAKFVRTLNHDRPFHCHRFVPDQNDGDGLIEPNNPCPPQRNYRYRRKRVGAHAGKYRPKSQYHATT